MGLASFNPSLYGDFVVKRFITRTLIFRIFRPFLEVSFWYPQRTHLRTSRFGNVVPSDLLRPVGSGS